MCHSSRCAVRVRLWVCSGEPRRRRSLCACGYGYEAASLTLRLLQGILAIVSASMLLCCTSSAMLPSQATCIAAAAITGAVFAAINVLLQVGIGLLVNSTYCDTVRELAAASHAGRSACRQPLCVDSNAPCPTPFSRWPIGTTRRGKWTPRRCAFRAKTRASASHCTGS